ncbi:hypothetical protein [Xanthomonas campestris]|uniref:Uncharacterized protein n=1 Tax=Xanthomonas campestris pv. papavericola TaxID=487881 RepID=A0AAJ2X190_XANCA|nr:hypothetical protein [Xanthomonas campestris]MEC3887137.1 hypothetical protein [Xanthomonas campestris pv. papavericola]
MTRARALSSCGSKPAWCWATCRQHDGASFEQGKPILLEGVDLDGLLDGQVRRLPDRTER